MLRSKLLVLGFGLLLVFGYWGCASRARLTTDQTYFKLKPVQPLSESDGVEIPENLIIKVENVADFGSSYKNRLDLYVNDYLIEPDDEFFNYQNVYHYRLKLQPGIYKVKALYYASSGWEEKAYPIVPRQNIKILPDTRTLVTAKIKKDWWGAPISDELYFNVKYEPLADKLLDKAVFQTPRADLAKGDSQLKAEPLREKAPQKPPVLKKELPHLKLPPKPEREVFVTPADNFVGLQINTIPSGADVIIDDRFVGQTPLKIYVDRLNSHIVQISCKGYKGVMKLLDYRQFGRQKTIHLMEKLEPELQ